MANKELNHSDVTEENIMKMNIQTKAWEMIGYRKILPAGDLNARET